MQIYKKLKKIKYLFLLIATLVLFLSPVLVGAQTPTPTPAPKPCDGVRIRVDGTNDLCFRTFRPFRGIASHGLIPAIGELFQFIILLMTLMWVINLFIILYNYLKNRGESAEIEKNWQSILYLWQGLTFVLGGIVVFTVLSLLFGAGLPFDWADEYTQCGFENEKVIYKQMRETTFQDPAYPPGTSVEIACCEVGDPDDAWYVIEKNGVPNSRVPSQYNPVEVNCIFNKVETVP